MTLPKAAFSSISALASSILFRAVRCLFGDTVRRPDYHEYVSSPLLNLMSMIYLMIFAPGNIGLVMRLETGATNP